MARFRRIISWLFAIAVVLAIGYSFRPQPLDVDWSTVKRGPLEVTVNEDGRSRIKEKYVVSTPLAGQIQRITLKPGDSVTAGTTLLATILPTNPELLDPRARNTAEARVRAAEAGVRRAEATSAAAKAAMEATKSMLERRQRLRQGEATFDQAVEDAQMLARVKSEEFHSAEFGKDIARFELEMAQAALIRTRPGDESAGREWHLDIISPIRGKVLKVFQESSTVLAAGAQLMEIGDPTDLELEVDVLSTDAVKILPGARMYIEHWGGETPVEARVRLVEPGAFTKVSALGVEEQRVNVIGDLVSKVPEQFGDRFRFESRIVTWHSDDVLKVSMSALFRHNQDWAVFAVGTDMKARRRIIKIGHRNSDEAEVLEGLGENDRVVIFPSDRVVEGVLLKLKTE